MADEPRRIAGEAAGRAKGELARVRDVRFNAVQSALIGLLIGCGATAITGGLNAAVDGETGYIVLMAAAVLAAWFGGLVGGVAATLTVTGLNQLLFLDPGLGTRPNPRVDDVRQVLFLVVATGTVLLISARRAARDRLVDALGSVATLAEQVESRDERLELMLAASGTGFWEWDIATGELTWSEAIFRQHGLEPAGAAPSLHAYLEMIHPDDRDAFQQAIGAAAETNGSFVLEYRVLWPDGTVHWTYGAGRMFRGDVGRPPRMIGTGTDITERRRIEEERDRLLADERRAGEFREAFIDVISHELRTPITSILGMTQILARPGRADDPATRVALLEDVRAESERLHRLVEDLLVLSRVERGRLVIDAEPIAPGRILERIVVQEAAELPSLRISLNLEPGLPIVAAEGTYLEQIVRNLLINAAKYTPAGTSVVVDARREDGAVAIRVCDEGPGISEESIDHLFELFYRDPLSARTVAGSGIGLFVSASLVEAMGGRIWATRSSGGGAEFGFTLRSIEGDEFDEHVPQPVSEPASSGVPLRLPEPRAG